MKTKSLILSFALVALTTTLFANEPTVNAQSAESELVIEWWMTAPFENSLSESELFIESWMTAPFENAITEEKLAIESWMTSPFEVVESIEVENWMAAAWI